MSKPAKKNPGLPKHQPTDATRQTVQLHVMVGSRQEVIADILGISVDTLYRHYKAEMDTAREKANASIGGALYKKAMGGDTTAMAYARGDFNASALTLGASHTIASIQEGLRAKGITLLTAVA